MCLCFPEFSGKYVSDIMLFRTSLLLVIVGDWTRKKFLPIESFSLRSEPPYHFYRSASPPPPAKRPTSDCLDEKPLALIASARNLEFHRKKGEREGSWNALRPTNVLLASNAPSSKQAAEKIVSFIYWSEDFLIHVMILFGPIINCRYLFFAFPKPQFGYQFARKASWWQICGNFSSIHHLPSKDV